MYLIPNSISIDTKRYPGLPQPVLLIDDLTLPNAVYLLIRPFVTFNGTNGNFGSVTACSASQGPSIWLELRML
jgi:hypothetical protein